MSKIPYDLVLKHCIEAVFIFDQKGHIFYANDAAMQDTGYMDELVNTNIMDIFPKALKVHNDNVIINRFEVEDIKETKEYSSIETFAYRKNQTCYPVRMKLVREDNGQESANICFVRNVTELNSVIKREKNVKEELKEATGVKNEFLANITHELRTPVNGMKGLADVLLSTELTQYQRENINIIRRCCDNMTNIINGILDFSKITAGKMQLENKVIDISNFLKNTLSYHIPKLNEKGLKLQVNIGDNVPTKILGDELRLEQILSNLISNAIKFTSVGQIVIEVINTEQKEDEVELFFMVIDSGIGISKEDMDKLFQSFSQVDGSITRRYGGTGLGLAISKSLVELMGGRIHLSSEIGRGSTFSFSAWFNVVKEDYEIETEPKLERNNGFTMENTTWNVISGDRQNVKTPGLLEPYALDKEAIAEHLEKLIICVELETWEKAENFASIIKKMIPESDQEGRKNAFRVELAVRKEDYEITQKQIKKLQDYLQS
jgi:PAS domain S-box-containing protein